VAHEPQLAAGLDLGAAYTRVLICALEDGCIRYIGHSAVPSRGWVRGQIADQNMAAEDIRQAVAEVEGRAGIQLGEVVVGVSGPFVRSQQARGIYDFGRPRPIDADDLRYTLDLARQTRLEEDRMLLQVAPQDFTVDGRPPMAHPLNLMCSRLEAHALLVTTSQQDHEVIESTVHQAHLSIQETVFEAFAAAYSSVLPEERAGGVCVVDLGGQSTGMVVYDADSMVYATGMPVSGDHFSRDVAELRSLSFDEAERLKIAHGCALVGLTADNILIELPADEGRPVREVSRRALNEILEARATQLFEMVEARRSRFASDIQLREGVVLTGAASQLEGLVEVAEKLMGCPARIGFPRGIENWPDELMAPEWTVPAGLAMYSARLRAKRKKPSGGPTLRSLVTLRG